MIQMRHSIRLPGYDYSRAGAYFVTVCTHHQRCLFGRVVNGQMKLNDAGRMVEATWQGLPDHYLHVELDAFVIMPNHIHAIIALSVGAGLVRAGLKRAGLKPAPTGVRWGLPEIVRALKTFSARRINQARGKRGQPVWQRNYYEHVIRNDQSLQRIRDYIACNPANWSRDPYRIKS